MNTASAFAPTEAPRGAIAAADLAYRLIRWLRALRFYAAPVSAARAVEAGAVRQYAQEMERGGNLPFAADLYAAADRHEFGH
jgi:hypothetical protein